MRPFFRSSLVGFFSSAALLLTACEAELNIKINSKQTDDSTYKTTVFRMNDKVSVNIESFTPGQSPEHFEFQCNDKSGMEAAYNQASADVEAFAQRVDADLKSFSIDLMDKPDTLNKMKATIDKLHYSRGKADAIKQARDFCDNKVEVLTP